MWHVLAKVSGWLQFVGALAAKFTETQPHGFSGWLTVAVSALAALGIHAASNTDGKV